MKNKAKKDSLTIIENIYYATNDYRLDDAGRKVLDKVIIAMNANPNISVELSSHTDSRSSDSYNLKLSRKRAKEAVRYMVAKGVNKKRTSKSVFKKEDFAILPGKIPDVLTICKYQLSQSYCHKGQY